MVVVAECKPVHAIDVQVQGKSAGPGLASFVQWIKLVSSNHTRNVSDQFYDVVANKRMGIWIAT